jgi:hypothetical protein
LIPYVQYYFEYPPLSGALNYLAGVAGNLFVYTTVMFSAAFLSMLVTLAFTYKLVVLRSGSTRRLRHISITQHAYLVSAFIEDGRMALLPASSYSNSFAKGYQT